MSRVDACKHIIMKPTSSPKYYYLGILASLNIQKGKKKKTLTLVEDRDANPSKNGFTHLIFKCDKDKHKVHQKPYLVTNPFANTNPYGPYLSFTPITSHSTSIKITYNHLSYASSPSPTLTPSSPASTIHI